MLASNFVDRSLEFLSSCSEFQCGGREGFRGVKFQAHVGLEGVGLDPNSTLNQDRRSGHSRSSFNICDYLMLNGLDFLH